MLSLYFTKSDDIKLKIWSIYFAPKSFTDLDSIFKFILSGSAVSFPLKSVPNLNNEIIFLNIETR